ncbi:SDR family NAD(P)-dependent oxidoreductase [bacterium]|nr:SDR family NAD(P)-dependent oxidoreductase [bacterium]
MQVDLSEQVALVTGSAHRVGKAIALELARRGVHILVHYNSSGDQYVRDTLHEIKSHGVDAFAIQADVSQPDGVAAIFSAVREHFGRLNILVNSASVFNKGQLMEVTLENWQRSLDVKGDRQRHHQNREQAGNAERPSHDHQHILVCGDVLGHIGRTNRIAPDD